MVSVPSDDTSSVTSSMAEQLQKNSISLYIEQTPDYLLATMNSLAIWVNGRCCNAAMLRCYDVMMLWCYDVMMLRFCDFAILRFCEVIDIIKIEQLRAPRSIARYAMLRSRQICLLLTMTPMFWAWKCAWSPISGIWSRLDHETPAIFSHFWRKNHMDWLSDADIMQWRGFEKVVRIFSLCHLRNPLAPWLFGCFRYFHAETRKIISIFMIL
jgi:hypothetical protein